MKILHTPCLVFLANFSPLISRDARITPSSWEEIVSKIPAHIVCI